MKKLYVSISLLFSLALLIPGNAQQVDMEQFETLKPRNIGPAGMSGRITAIDVDLSDPDRIFAGAASGGVWQSENGGISWKPIFDEIESMSVGALKINQKNPSEIWVGSGEANPRNSHNSGSGVFKSIDGGKTWKSMGLKNTKLIHRIIIDRDNPNIVYVGASGSAWGDSEDRGVFKTEDGGESWTKILFVNQSTGVADMVVDPSNPNKILVAMWEFRRTPWDFVSGGKGSGLYLTYDGGKNWKKLSNKEGLPKGDLGRMGIAFSPSKPNIVYALIEAKKNGLYRSLNGGENWQLVSEKNIGNRPFYYAEIYVDPKNENRLFNLYTYVSRSEDGGKTFKVIADYGNSVHPDHHAFWIHPEDPEFLIDGNDGGLNISRDGGNTWQFAANIPVGQFYHVAVDNDFPYNVYGGMQDNGTWAGPAYVLKRGGIRNADWQEVLFGDGFDAMADSRDNRFGFAMSQGGNLSYYDRLTGKTKFVKPVHPDGEKLRFNWNAAMAQDPFNPTGIYYGSQYVHYSDDYGESWRIISPDLTTNDTLKQKQDQSGGLTIDATNAENHTTILSISPSPVDANVIWVGTDDGNLQLSQDGGTTWNKMDHSLLPGCPKGAWIPHIELSRSNAGEAFVSINNYRMNDWSAYLYHTSDYGKSWTRIVDDNDVNGFVLCMIQDPKESNLLFLGTDVGLYVSFDYGANWTKWSKTMPSVQIRDMKIQEREGDLVIGTFGRAFWVVDDINPLRELASTGVTALENEFLAFEAPTAYLTSYRSYDGIRFVAQGEFIGENKRRGAMMTVWNKPAKKEKKEKKEKIDESKKEKKKKKKDGKSSEESDNSKKAKKPKAKKDKLKVIIVDQSGDTIRSFTRRIKEGMNRIYWGLERDGIPFPSRRDARPDSDTPGGIQVLPGTYKAYLKFGDQMDSTLIEVKNDPRSVVSEESMKSIAAFYDEYYGIVDTARVAFDKIKNAKKSIKLISDIAKLQTDSIKTRIDSLTKDASKKLRELEELYMMPEGLKGIQRDPSKLTGVISTASSYLGSSWKEPQQNALNALENAKKKTIEVVQEVNQYFNKEWPQYKEEIESLTLNLFKG